MAQPSDPRQASPRPRVMVDGVGFDPVTEAETISLVLARLDEGRGGRIITPNVDILRQLRRPEVLHQVDGADLVLADGFPIVLASRLAGQALPQRVTGSSLIHSLSRAVLAAGHGVLLVGGNDPGTGRLAAEELMRSVGGSGKVDHHFPAFGFERTEHGMSALRDALSASRARVVFVGLGFPKQDVLGKQLLERYPHTWFIGCGGSIAMLAHEVRRAPRWAQRLGVEWVFRLAQEPRRLAHRYLVDDLPYAFGLLLRAFRRRRSS